jgi:hypothetical protein
LFNSGVQLNRKTTREFFKEGAVSKFDSEFFFTCQIVDRFSDNLRERSVRRYSKEGRTT